MQKIICAVFFLCSSFITKAQFSTVDYIDSLPQFEVMAQVESADFNNDGLPDIISLVNHFPVDSMRLYISQGNGDFIRHTITGMQTVGGIEYFGIADINNDGWTDFAAITNNATVLTWYQNNGGSFIPHTLASNLDFTTRLLIRDFDGNGLPDILALQHAEIVLYLQSSAGVFEAGSVVHSGTEFYAIDAGYYNQDSLLDIAVASGGFEALLNEGNGQFRVQSQAGIRICFGLQSADLDNDNVPDMGVYESIRGIMFYKNDGNGNFSFADTILNSSDNFETFGFTDFDCDGDNDLYTTIRQQGRVVWVENKQAGDFAPPKNIHVQTGQLVAAVCTGDLNTDGKADVIWGNRRAGFNTNSNACPLCVFTFTSNIAGAIYQWLVNDGSGYVPVTDNAVYSGSSTGELKLTAPTTSWYGYKYQCLVNNSELAQVNTLKFSTYWTGAINTSWENPANWRCGFLPDENTDATVNADVLNFPQVNTIGVCRSLLLLPGARLRSVSGSVLRITK